MIPLRRTFKYEVPVADHPVIQLPVGAQVLSVGVQGEQVYVWALVPVEGAARTFVPVQFHVYGTGHDVTHTRARFLGTVLLRGGALVFHVWTESWVGV